MHIGKFQNSNNSNVFYTGNPTRPAELARKPAKNSFSVQNRYNICMKLNKITTRRGNDGQ